MTRANVDVFISDLDLVIAGSLLVIARRAHGAVALDDGDTAARLGVRHAHRVLERAPLARKIGDGDAARAALVHAPDAVARFGDREQGSGRGHQLPLMRSSFFTALTPPTRF